MEKFLSLTLIFFFGTTLNSNAQDLYNYYDIYKTDNAGTPQNKMSTPGENSINFNIKIMRIKNMRIMLNLIKNIFR